MRSSEIRFPNALIIGALSVLSALHIEIQHAWGEPIAQPLRPRRPNLSKHDQRQRGVKGIADHYALARVGACAHDVTSTTDPKVRSSPLYRLGLARLDAHCSAPPKLKLEDLIPVMSGVTLERARDASPEQIAGLRVAWEHAQREDDVTRCQTRARALLTLSAPERTYERFRLSEALCTLKTLDLGPPPEEVSEPERAWSALQTLAVEARGEQVRASALATIASRALEPELAHRARQTLWRELPQTPSARALGQTDAIHDLGGERRDPLTWFHRGEAAFKARDYQLTIDALRRYSPLSALDASSIIESLNLTPQVEPLVKATGVTDTERTQSALKIAISLMRLRIYPDETERQLKRAQLSSETSIEMSAVYYTSHLLSRQKRWDESLAKLRLYIARGPEGRRKREARYQVGRVLHQAGRYRAAIKAHRRFLRTRPRDRVKYEWFLGWSHFRAGDCRGARRVWEPLLSNRNVLVGPKARYWSARCHVIEGHKRRALRDLKTLRREAELSYYGLLGVSLESRLRDRPFHWRNPLRASRSAHWREAAPRLPSSALKRLTRHRDGREPARGGRRALELAAWGEEMLARSSAREVCDASVKRRHTRLIGRKRLRTLCDRLAFYTGDHGIRWKRQASARIAWRVRFKADKPVARVGAYPLAYYDLSVAAAELESISPWWLMAHMLQESRYRPEVVSYAQAIGPMQILGRTGKRIHARLQWPQGEFFSDQLYDPALSIRYAAWYLNHLSKDLGHPLLAIGAYNGGPMRFADHQELFRGQPFDVMVEEMGAHESRNYLRKVTDHFIRYLALYASPKEWERWTQRLAPPELTPIPKRTVGF